MDKVDVKRTLAAIVLFGSIWGTLECILGNLELTGALKAFPMGALLGGFFGLGIMASSRRLFGVAWMQLAIAVVAGIYRFWAPIGQCVICSCLAIVAEGLVFELVFNRPVFNITLDSKSELLNVRSLALLGVISGYVIYVAGYMFTQIMTPILAPPHTFVLSNFVAALPLILGRGFFAALFGAVSLPLAVTVRQLNVNINAVKNEHYYPLTASVSAVCWILVLAFF